MTHMRHHKKKMSKKRYQNSITGHVGRREHTAVAPHHQAEEVRRGVGLQVLAADRHHILVDAADLAVLLVGVDSLPGRLSV